MIHQALDNRHSKNSNSIYFFLFFSFLFFRYYITLSIVELIKNNNSTRNQAVTEL